MGYLSEDKTWFESTAVSDQVQPIFDDVGN